MADEAGVSPDLERRLRELLTSWQSDFSAFADGELAAANARFAAAGCAPVSPALRALIDKAQTLEHQSGGLFNPALAELVALWGFDSTPGADATPPPAERIAALVAKEPSSSALRLAGAEVCASRPVALDLGGFAKGAIVDALLERLTEAGIANAIVNAGGDLKVSGRRGAREWRIAVKHPRESRLLAAIDARDGEAIFTSGDYERFFEHEGSRYHHILDPRDGYPARGATSATVLATDAGLADAAATALFVAGPAGFADAVRALRVDAAMLVSDDGRITLTPAMAERIEFLEPKPSITVLSP